MANVTARLIDHTVVGDTTQISSSSLGTKLIHDRESALSLMRATAPSLQAEDIAMDSAGRITVKNAEFASAIQAKLVGVGNVDAALGNGTCGLGC